MLEKEKALGLYGFPILISSKDLAGGTQRISRWYYVIGNANIIGVFKYCKYIYEKSFVKHRHINCVFTTKYSVGLRLKIADLYYFSSKTFLPYKRCCNYECSDRGA